MCGRRAGRRGPRARDSPARRGIRPVHGRARRARGPVAVRAGRRLPGRADRSAGRDLPRGPRARPRPARRPSRGGAVARAAARGRAGRHRAARGGAVPDPGRAAGQRAGHAPAQLRALDHRGSAHLAVRAAPAGGAGHAARRHRAGRAAGRDGQRAGRGRRRPVRQAASRAGRRPTAAGAPVRQAVPAGPQDRPRHRARHQLGRAAGPRHDRSGLPALGQRGPGGGRGFPAGRPRRSAAGAGPSAGNSTGRGAT